MASLQSALHDARRGLDSIDVKHRAGLSEDGLVDETLSVLVQCWPGKVVEAAAACTRSPAVAPYDTYAAAYAASPVTYAAASPPTRKAKSNPLSRVGGGAAEGYVIPAVAAFIVANSPQDLLSLLQNPKVRSDSQYIADI